MCKNGGKCRFVVKLSDFVLADKETVLNCFDAWLSCPQIDQIFQSEKHNPFIAGKPIHEC